MAAALVGRLPLHILGDALGQPDTPGWQDALGAESDRSEVRRATLEAISRALGPQRATVASGAPGWRPLSGTDVDLLAPDPVAISRSLERAGFVPVRAHDEAGRRVLVRCAQGRAVDLVDIEACAPEALEPAGDGWSRLTHEAAVRRFRDRLAERDRVRLVDLADAEELGVPASPGERRPPAQGRRTRVRVVLTGSGVGGEAERLAASLRVAALDVVVAAGVRQLPRAAARHLRDRAALVVAGPVRLPGAIAVRVPPGGLSDEAAVDLLRRATG